MINMPWPDRRFKEVWEFWKQYKYNEWRRFKYKSEQSEQTALNLLYKMASGDLETAIAIIERSASNRWQGLFPFNNGQTTTNTKPGTSEARINALKKW